MIYIYIYSNTQHFIPLLLQQLLHITIKLMKTDDNSNNANYASGTKNANDTNNNKHNNNINI